MKPSVRPKTCKPWKRHQVILDAETAAKARQLGAGNLSNGLRIAMKSVSVPVVLPRTN